jgi:hypothetical protein
MAEPFNPAGQRRTQQAAPVPVTQESLTGSSTARPSPVHGNKVTEATSPRIDAERASRRRRQNNGPMTGLKLAVPEELKEEGFQYRWVNDDGRRIHGKTVMDDYDIVTEQKIEGTGEGTPVKRLVGKQDGGAPLYAYLCRKPTDFYQADKGRELRTIKEREDAMKRGPGAIEGGLPGGSTSYVPGQGNQIG